MKDVVEQESAITDAEWEVMRIIWTLGKAHSNKVITELQAECDWTESTIKTLLRRLVKKGLLRTEPDGRRFIYIPTVSQTAMMSQMARQFLDKLCDMHKGEVLIQLLKEAPLSKGDIKAMQQELKLKEKDAPDMVPCNCLPSEKSRC